jgi:hypothetical protein
MAQPTLLQTANPGRNALPKLGGTVVAALESFVCPQMCIAFRILAVPSDQHCRQPPEIGIIELSSL